MVIELIASTWLRIFDLYVRYPRRLLDLCALVAFVSLVFGLAVGALVAVVAYALDLMPAAYAMDLYGFMYYGMFRDNYGAVVDFTTLGLGLFAIHLRRVGEFQLPQFGFGGFWRSLTARNWTLFAFLCAGSFVLRLFFINPLFDTAGDVGMFEIELGAGSFGSTGDRYANWANNTIAYVLTYLPYLLVLYMLLDDERQQRPKRTRRELWKVVKAVVLLGFVVDALYASIRAVLDAYILPPFFIAFEGSMIAAVVTLMIAIMLIGLLLPATLLTVVGPLDAVSNSVGKETLDKFDAAGDTGNGPPAVP